MAKRTTYTPEFKADAVAKLAEEGASLNSVADAIGVHKNVLRSWRDKMAEAGGVTADASGTSTFPTARAARAPVGATSLVGIMETLMANHGIKMPAATDIENGARAITKMGREIDLEEARLIAATVLSAVAA